jgi:predicted dehydrogenase
MIRIGFVGAGLIGSERVRATAALQASGYPLQAVGIVDAFAANTAELTASIGTQPRAEIDDLLVHKPDWIVVATPHDVAVPLVTKFLQAGVKVLVEKPLGRNLEEAKRIAAIASQGSLWVGQNFRFYRGIAAFMADVRARRFGPLSSISLQFGHGAGPKDKTSWKLDPVRAGGGVLIDPGIHLLDLMNLLEDRPPDFIGGTAWSGFWNTGIEEDIHFIAAGSACPVYDVKISIVRWRSLFRLEAHGLEGYGIVEGRGRSYGPQRYVRGPRWGWQNHASQAAAEELVVETDGTDVFIDEMRMLLFGEGEVAGARPCSVDEALANMRLLDDLRARIGIRQSL